MNQEQILILLLGCIVQEGKAAHFKFRQKSYLNDLRNILIESLFEWSLHPSDNARVQRFTRIAKQQAQDTAPKPVDFEQTKQEVLKSLSKSSCS